MASTEKLISEEQIIAVELLTKTALEVVLTILNRYQYNALGNITECPTKRYHTAATVLLEMEIQKQKDASSLSGVNIDAAHKE